MFAVSAVELDGERRGVECVFNQICVWRSGLGSIGYERWVRNDSFNQGHNQIESSFALYFLKSLTSM